MAIELEPVTRLEHYLAKIAGEDVSAPDPFSRKEYFLAKLAEMEVTPPDPVTREEKFLSDLIGEGEAYNLDPVTRLEHFMAKAANQTEEELEPVTREEIFWQGIAEAYAKVEKTVSGAIVHIRDALAGPAQNVTIAIEPVQAGTGDPSPDNVRPITGWTGANVYRTGKNLFPATLPSNAIAGTLSSAGTIVSATNARIFAIPCKANTDLYFSQSTTGNALVVAFSSKAPAVGDTIDYRGNMTNRLEWGLNSGNNTFLLLQISNTSYWDALIAAQILIEIGTSKTAYEAPNDALTIPIAFPTPPGTVYGGTLDVTTGVLTVTHVSETFTGSNIYSADSDFSSARKYAAVRRAYTSKTAGYRVSNSYKALLSTDTDTTGFLFVSNTNLRVRVFDPRFTDLATAQTLLNATPFQLVYELATPQTYQLTSHEVQLLKGENNLWSDTGSTTLTYLADGRASDTEALGILLAGRYVNHGAADEATDAEALNILLGGKR